MEDHLSYESIRAEFRRETIFFPPRISSRGREIRRRYALETLPNQPPNCSSMRSRIDLFFPARYFADNKNLRRSVFISLSFFFTS